MKVDIMAGSGKRNLQERLSLHEHKNRQNRETEYQKKS